MSTSPESPSTDKAAEERMWRFATWSAVLLFQAVVGLFMAAMLAQTKLGVHTNDVDAEGHKILIAAAATTTLALVMSAPLLLNRHPVARGIGIGLSTSAIIFAIGVVTFVLWLS